MSQIPVSDLQSISKTILMVIDLIKKVCSVKWFYLVYEWMEDELEPVAIAGVILSANVLN